MECNKVKAKKALDIAEIKLSKNDYVGAKKFSEKAQNLYPQLDGLKQVSMMINVYMIASEKINGIGDWYGILGVDPLANDETVKKQYKMLALLLHPDKNKRKGAEEAFKLVSEAWCLLSDKVKRSEYDQKRKFAMQNPQKPASNKPASGMAKPASSSVDPRAKAKGNKPTSSGWNVPKGNKFWTNCTNCNIPLSFEEYHLNKAKRCLCCDHTFIATKQSAPSTKHFPPETNRNTNGDSSATPETQEASTKSQEATNKDTKADASPQASSAQNQPTKKCDDMFWTICTHCNLQFRLEKEYYLNKAKRCSYCGHTFIATEKSAPCTKPFPPNTNGDSSATPETQEASTKSPEASNKDTKAIATPQESIDQNQPTKKTKKGKYSFKFCGPSINVPQGENPTCTDSSSSQPQQQGSTQSQSTSQNTSGGTRDTSASASFSINWSCPYSGLGIYRGGNVTNQAQGSSKRALEKPQEYVRFKKARTEVI